jgi:glycosyltransferase involved in cell wall biosynthesis
MRVAILTPSFLPAYNGMTFSSLQHATMLLELGHDVSIVAACPEEHRCAISAFLEDRGIGFLPTCVSGSGLISRPIVGDVGSLVERIGRLEPHVVLVEGRFFWGYHIIPQLRDRGVRIALISHGSAPDRFEWSPSWLLKAFAYRTYGCTHEQRVLGALDSVAVLSSHEDSDRFRDAQLYRRHGLVPVVIGNTSLEGVARQVPRIGGTPGRLRLAVVGDMSPLKNQLAAIPLVEGNGSISFVRFYFPAENRYSIQVASRASERGVINFQYRTGLDREGVMQSLGDIDLMLCLSRTEAQPLSLIDGLACSVPFLSRPVGCMPSMKGGLVCEIGEMREIIRRLAGDAVAMSDLVQQAKRFFQSMHSEAAVKPALSALLSAALRDERVSRRER